MTLAVSLKSFAIAVVSLFPDQGSELEPGTKEAYQLYRAGKIEEASKAFAIEAQKGEPAAMFALAAIQQERGGESGALDEVTRLYQGAAEKGYVPDNNSDRYLTGGSLVL